MQRHSITKSLLVPRQTFSRVLPRVAESHPYHLCGVSALQQALWQDSSGTCWWFLQFCGKLSTWFVKFYSLIALSRFIVLGVPEGCSWADWVLAHWPCSPVPRSMLSLRDPRRRRWILRGGSAPPSALTSPAPPRTLPVSEPGGSSWTVPLVTTMLFWSSFLSLYLFKHVFHLLRKNVLIACAKRF